MHTLKIFGAPDLWLQWMAWQQTYEPPWQVHLYHRPSYNVTGPNSQVTHLPEVLMKPTWLHSQ